MGKGPVITKPAAPCGAKRVSDDLSTTSIPDDSLACKLVPPSMKNGFSGVGGGAASGTGKMRHM